MSKKAELPEPRLTEEQKNKIYKDTLLRTKDEIQWLAKIHDLAQKVAGDVFCEMCTAAKRVLEERDLKKGETDEQKS